MFIIFLKLSYTQINSLMNEMFLKNKYSKWYFDIIEKRKSRKLNEKYEIHHIIPKKLGGNNNLKNLIKLTYKEHFICHLLLTKMLNGLNKKYMIHALNLMAHTRKIKINSRLYEYIKKEYSNQNKKELNAMWGKKKLNHPAFGYKHTEEHKKYISNKLKGRKHTLETKLKMSEKAKNRKVTLKTRKKISKKNSGKNNPNFGKKHSDEIKQKMKKNHWSKKKELHKKWRIFNIFNKKEIIYQGNLKSFCLKYGCDRSSTLKKTLKTKKPIQKGKLKGFILFII